MLLSRYELHGSDTSGERQGLDGHAAQYPNSNGHGSNPQSNPISADKDSENNLPDNTPVAENPNEQENRCKISYRY